MPQIRSAILTKYARYLVLALLIYVPVFGYLDNLPIRVWDEARIAINAYEMFETGEWIVTTFDFQPDMWNTKPPFLIWCQVMLMHLVGVNELAIRLPTAFAVFGTCMALLVFSMRYLRSYWFGFIAVLLLISSEGFMRFHAGRTGDYDAMLTFFTTLSSLFLFSFCETGKTKFLYFFFSALTLAALTKGIAGLLFAPAWVLYVLTQKKIFLFLRNKHFYSGLFFFLVLAVGYYFLRDARNPGYLAIIQENELGGRYLVSQGDQKLDFWFYYDNFRSYKLADRYLLVPCGILIGLVSGFARIRRLSLFVLLITVTFFLVISTGQTRLEWYDAPLYPFFSLIIAFIIHYFFRLLKENEWINRTLVVNVLPFIFLFLVFIKPYESIFSKIYLQKEFSWEIEYYQPTHYLRDALKGKHDVNNILFAYDGYHAHNEFYMRQLREKGVNIKWRHHLDLRPGEKVMVSQRNVHQLVEDNFEYKELKKDGIISIYQLLRKKTPAKNESEL